MNVLRQIKRKYSFTNIEKNVEKKTNSVPSMYQKLHIQLTLFCTMVTGMILMILTLVCLSISEKALERNGYLSFLSDLNSMLTHLESQTVITHQWLSKMELNQRFLIQVYDQGRPLYYQSLKRSRKENRLIDQTAKKAKEEYSLDISVPSENNVVSQHKEFTMKSGTASYYASAAVLPKENGQLGCIILYPLANQKQEIFRQRYLFGLADCFAILILLFFSWIFTERIIRPLEENRKKQTSFIASASHELRSPLAVILSSLSAMEKADEIKREHFIHAMYSEGKRMSRLIDDMLLLANSDAKSWSLTLSPADADTILLDVFEKYEYIAAKKSLRFFIELPDDSLSCCLCDRERIIQVLSILLDNAVSYTPSGESISLALSYQNSSLLFSVADTGPGIPDSDKKRIFERFYRTDTSRTEKEHFGLGLSIAQEIVKAHGGQIFVRDNQPKGTCFFIRLPVK